MCHRFERPLAGRDRILSGYACLASAQPLPYVHARFAKMSGRNILIVEPNPGILIVGRNVLARAGFHVIAVSSVDEGLVEAKRRPLDVVLLDGKQSEPEFLISFARSRTQGVPIILTVQKGRDVITI